LLFGNPSVLRPTTGREPTAPLTKSTCPALCYRRALAAREQILSVIATTEMREGRTPFTVYHITRRPPVTAYRTGIDQMNRRLVLRKDRSPLFANPQAPPIGEVPRTQEPCQADN
jgi:hypothetical protein